MGLVGPMGHGNRLGRYEVVVWGAAHSGSDPGVWAVDVWIASTGRVVVVELVYPRVLLQVRRCQRV